MVIVKRVPEIKISYKTQREYERYTIRSSADAFMVLSNLYDWTEIELRETFITLYLNRANHVLGFTKNGIGSSAGVVIDIKQILATACKANASSIVVSHNHPSSNLAPSQQDLDLTHKLKDGGKLLEIQLLDHLIIVPDGRYMSLSDEAYL